MLRDEYVAGLFDGEGSVGIYRNGQGKYHLRTQLTQNHTPASERLAKGLVSTYGGHYSVQLSVSRTPYFNWQLSTEVALRFLERVYPYLILKKQQAELAIAWQRQRPKPHRLPTGHFARYANSAYDERVALALKHLKQQDYDAVMAAQSDLVEIVYELRQVVCVKG